MSGLLRGVRDGVVGGGGMGQDEGLGVGDQGAFWFGALTAWSGAEAWRSMGPLFHDCMHWIGLQRA